MSEGKLPNLADHMEELHKAAGLPDREFISGMSDGVVPPHMVEATEKQASETLAKMKSKMKDKPECAMPGPPQPPYSVNNRLIVESYKEDRGLKATVNSGFAMISQKVTVKGMKVLMDADLHVHGQLWGRVRKGDMAYIREEYLHSQPWAKKMFSSDAVEGDFMIVDLAMVEFVVPK